MARPSRARYAEPMADPQSAQFFADGLKGLKARDLSLQLGEDGLRKAPLSVCAVGPHTLQLGPGVVECLDQRSAERGAAAGEDDVFHVARAQMLDTLLAERPTETAGVAGLIAAGLVYFALVRKNMNSAAPQG